MLPGDKLNSDKLKFGLDNLTEKDFDDDLLNVTTWYSIGKYKQVVNQFMVPALIKYNFKNHFYVEVGLQFGLRFKGFIDAYKNIPGTKSSAINLKVNIPIGKGAASKEVKE